MFAFSETFTLHTKGVTGQDADGNDIYGSTDTPLYGAFAPAGSTELVQGQDTVLSHDTLYLEAGSATPAPTDTITVRGTVRLVDGRPQDFRNPFTGWHPGPVVRLLEVTG